MKYRTAICALVTAMALTIPSAEAQLDTNTGTVETRVGPIQLELGVPTNESIDKLYDELDFASAYLAYVWAMPAVNQAGYIYSWRNIFKAEWGQPVALPSSQDRRGTLTPTTSSTYVMVMTDLSETGPFIFEDFKGNHAGIITDLWHRLLAEVGNPGPFKGEGGKTLIIGPGQQVPADTKGFHVIKSAANNIFIGTRLLDDDKEKAVRELGPQFRGYPYAERENPPERPLILANDRKWTQNPPTGLAYFERLAKILLNEPVAERDRFMMAKLRTLGIEVGKPFKPDERQKKILTEAARLGELTLRAATARRRGTMPYWEGTQWKELFVYPPSQREEHFDHFEERALLYWEIFGIGIQSTGPGTGSKYTVTHWDKNGDLLDGGKSYRLRIPANVPAKLFWSVVAYDEGTRTFIDGTDNTMIGSQEPGYEINPDGSIDVYFGPTAPEGKEANWIETKPGRAWFSYFRFFGPTEPFFDKTWRLPEFEPLADK
jgi:hypothetical protein